MTQEDRIDFWTKIKDIAGKRPKVLCDIEWDIAEDERLAWLKPERLIISYHNFEDPIEKEDKIFNSILEMPAKVIKFAIKGKTISDCFRVKQNIETAQYEDREMIGIAMDEPGVISRVLGPSWGSYQTYASLAGGKGSAPGQITIDEMMRVYRVKDIDDDTLFTGLIGNPVSHSVSPAMHNAAFVANRIKGVYLPLLVDDLGEFFEKFVRPSSQELDWNLRGLSVTIPHKVNVIPFMDELSETAQAVGAVNTITVEEDDLVGDNTDVAGAMAPLEKLTSLHDARVAVIGAGGAARAVIYGLTEAQSDVTVFGKRIEASDALADEFKIKSAAWSKLCQDDFDIVINTTPIGMTGHVAENTIPDLAVTKCKIYYDLVYNPLETELMRTATAAGVKVIGGLDMLVAQGAEQFVLWTLQQAPVDVMMKAALNKLKEANQ